MFDTEQQHIIIQQNSILPQLNLYNLSPNLNKHDKHNEFITPSNDIKKPHCRNIYAVPNTYVHVDNIAEIEMYF